MCYVKDKFVSATPNGASLKSTDWLHFAGRFAFIKPIEVTEVTERTERKRTRYLQVPADACRCPLLSEEYRRNTR